MFDQAVSAVIDALLAIPPVRFVMGLVEARWRPLWAALWLAVIAYVVARTLNQLAARRLRLQLLRESLAMRAPGSATVNEAPPTAPAEETTTESGAEIEASVEPAHVAARKTPVVPPRAPSIASAASVPVPVLLGSLAVAALVVVGVAFAMRAVPNGAASSVLVDSAVADSAKRSEPAMDVRWRSGRMDDDDCIGTFEVSNGTGTRVRFAAFVMDSSGAVMARDSARVASAVSGLFVEFRFRHVDCDEIADWRLEATTPKRRE